MDGGDGGMAAADGGAGATAIGLTTGFSAVGGSSRAMAIGGITIGTLACAGGGDSDRIGAEGAAIVATAFDASAGLDGSVADARPPTDGRGGSTWTAVTDAAAEGGGGAAVFGSGGAGTEGADAEAADTGGADDEPADTEGAGAEAADTGGAVTEDVDTGGTDTEDADTGGADAAIAGPSFGGSTRSSTVRCAKIEPSLLARISTCSSTVPRSDGGKVTSSSGISTRSMRHAPFEPDLP